MKFKVIEEFYHRSLKFSVRHNWVGVKCSSSFLSLLKQRSLLEASFNHYLFTSPFPTSHHHFPLMTSSRMREILRCWDSSLKFLYVVVSQEDKNVLFNFPRHKWNNFQLNKIYMDNLIRISVCSEKYSIEFFNFL